MSATASTPTATTRWLTHFGTLALHLGSFAITLAIWSGLLDQRFGAPISAVIIAGGTLVMVPVSLAGLPSCHEA